MEKLIRFVSSWAGVGTLFAVLFGGGLAVPAHHFPASVTMFVTSTLMMVAKIISVLDGDESRAGLITVVLVLAFALCWWEIDYAKDEIRNPGFERPFIGPVVFQPREEPKPEPPKITVPKAEPPKPKPSKPKPEPPKQQTPPVVAGPAYGNLALRCKNLGDQMVAYANSQDSIQPNPGTDKAAYNQWIQTTDGMLRARARFEIDSLQHDLATVNVRSVELDDALRRYRETFEYRNHVSAQITQSCVENPSPVCYTTTYDIRQIGKLFQELAAQIPNR